ncbi:hypothetical protein GmHk_14G040741 [Glycine max]|nr:hypothetical protein GmHk_14G040741 [Glycine max]
MGEGISTRGVPRSLLELTLKTTVDGKNDQGTPKWIEVKIIGPNLGPWAQKSTLRFMRTLGPSSAALAQSSGSLLLMALGGLHHMFKVRGYECGYYVMHWMWNIWFTDDTTLDIETITTIRKKWAAYFLKVKNM